MGDLIDHAGWEHHWPEEVLENIFFKLPLRDFVKVGAISRLWRAKFTSLVSQIWSSFFPVLWTYPDYDEEFWDHFPIREKPSLVAFHGPTKKWEHVPSHPSVFDASRLISFLRISGPVLLQVYCDVPGSLNSEESVTADERVRLVNIFTGEFLALPVIGAIRVNVKRGDLEGEYRVENRRVLDDVLGVGDEVNIYEIHDVLFSFTLEGFRVILIYGLGRPERLLMFELLSTVGFWKRRVRMAAVDSYPTSQSSLMKDDQLYVTGAYPNCIRKYGWHQDERKTGEGEDMDFEIQRVSFESLQSSNDLAESRFVGLACRDGKLLAVTLDQNFLVKPRTVEASVYEVNEETMNLTRVSRKDVSRLIFHVMVSGYFSHHFKFQVAYDDENIYLWQFDEQIADWLFDESAKDFMVYNLAEEKWSKLPLILDYVEGGLELEVCGWKHNLLRGQKFLFQKLSNENKSPKPW